MTKAELASKVGDKLGISSKVTIDIIDEVINVIKESVRNGEAVSLRGFGTFEPHTFKARIARNISKGTPVKIPECVKPRFVPSDIFKDQVMQKK